MGSKKPQEAPEPNGPPVIPPPPPPKKNWLGNLLGRWKAAKPPEPEPEPVSCLVYVIGGPHDRCIVNGRACKGWVQIPAIDNTQGYSVTTVAGICGSRTILVHESVDMDPLSYLLASYCRKVICK